MTMKIPIKVFSNVKPSTFQILTVWSEDAVARYLEDTTKKLITLHLVIADYYRG